MELYVICSKLLQHTLNANSKLHYTIIKMTPDPISDAHLELQIKINKELQEISNIFQRYLHFPCLPVLNPSTLSLEEATFVLLSRSNMHNAIRWNDLVMKDTSIVTDEDYLKLMDISINILQLHSDLKDLTK